MGPFFIVGIITEDPVMRIKAIDVFRAITMWMMLFVNDFWGLENIPHWLEHAAANEDMLGFSDTIFPAFLFIMGVSVPFALRNRLQKGDSLPQVMLHIGLRTLALVVMGVFTVNYEALDSAAAGLGHPWFGIVMTVAFFLIWAVYPKTEVKWRRGLYIAMRCAGVGLLVWLYFIYAGRGGTAFGVRWWGILGLIGWSYLVSAVVWLVVRDRVVWNFVAWGLAILYCIPGAKGGAHFAFAISGLLVSALMSRYASPTSPKRFLVWMGWLAAVMAVCGHIAHGFWIVSKIQATPTWLFYCCAIFFPLFGLIYWLTETRGKVRWFDFIAPAGTVTLTCYIIPYALSIRPMLDAAGVGLLSSGVPGLAVSLLYAWLVIVLAGVMYKYLRVRLKI
uniref:Heparan-alpha-glucosaminide N-acetyltransferase catalytic domain-containing protein n=1 Tax=termite gut metagenome TaxID=433724 RepID=S0DE96_9ZZZZ